jgi:hypothetical protein
MSPKMVCMGVDWIISIATLNIEYKFPSPDVATPFECQTASPSEVFESFSEPSCPVTKPLHKRNALSFVYSVCIQLSDRPTGTAAVCSHQMLLTWCCYTSSHTLLSVLAIAHSRTVLIQYYFRHVLQAWHGAACLLVARDSTTSTVAAAQLICSYPSQPSCNGNCWSSKSGRPLSSVVSASMAAAAVGTDGAGPSTRALVPAEGGDVDLGVHPSGIVPQLQNVVATVDLGCKLDLKEIALQARNAEYNPKVCVSRWQLISCLQQHSGLPPTKQQQIACHTSETKQAGPQFPSGLCTAMGFELGAAGHNPATAAVAGEWAMQLQGMLPPGLPEAVAAVGRWRRQWRLVLLCTYVKAPPALRPIDMCGNHIGQPIHFSKDKSSSSITEMGWATVAALSSCLLVAAPVLSCSELPLGSCLSCVRW